MNVPEMFHHLIRFIMQLGDKKMYFLRREKKLCQIPMGNYSPLSITTPAQIILVLNSRYSKFINILIKQCKFQETLYLLEKLLFTNINNVNNLIEVIINDNKS